MSAPLLELKDVHTHIGPYHILHGVNFAVPRGEVTLLMGRNGAGKTTTLRTILGLWRASAGSIEWNGRQVGHLKTHDMARLGIGYVPENMGIFPELTVREHLVLGASHSVSPQDHAQRMQWIFSLFPAVERFWNSPAGLLSGGQKQMVAVARAIVQPRELLIIDEPSKGLAPAIVDNMIRALHQLKSQGVTILLVEQNISFAKTLGDHVCVMDDGTIIHTGAMAALAADAALQTRLLGLTI